MHGVRPRASTASAAGRGRPPRLRHAAGLLVVAVLLSGCATFPDGGSRDWQAKAEGQGELGGPPALAPPDSRAQPPGASPTPQPRSGGSGAQPPCVDPDPQVVATCLNPIGAIAVLPGGDEALVGERTTGRVLQVKKGSPPRLVSTVPVDPATGLTGLVLSPGYAEDQLIYAFAGTPTDGQVLRIAPGEPPKPVLTGIPRAGGALAVDPDGSLLVATGAGAGPLAGRILRIDTLGRPAAGNPDPASPVLASGLTAPGGLCVDPASRTVWATDRAAGRDVLHRVRPGVLGAPAWTWPDRPGVSGCAVLPGTVAVAERGAKALFVLNPGENGSFTGDPKPVLAGTYGSPAATATGPDGLLWLGTVNKDGGRPGATDDRVIRLKPPSGGGGSAA